MTSELVVPTHMELLPSLTKLFLLLTIRPHTALGLFVKTFIGLIPKFVVVYINDVTHYLSYETYTVLWHYGIVVQVS